MKIYPSLAYVGENLNSGPLPAIIYFALSKEDSLNLDPYNQPVLPCHGEGYDKKDAISNWADLFQDQPLFFSEFINECVQTIQTLIHDQVIDPEHLAVAGLSRGAWIAVHVAAKIKEIKTILGFAPLTTFDFLPEFKNIDCKNLNLNSLKNNLINKNIRFYIGNRDLRVGTKECFQFINDLTEIAYFEGVRSPQLELYISPSVGHLGHGTLPHIFEDGANWLRLQLL